MHISKSIKIVIISLLLILSGIRTPVFCENYIKKLDDVRTSIIEQGQDLPGLIKQSQNNDLRTLERIYELSTSALATIEAYFKMLKIAVSSESAINKKTLDSLNEWLLFIHNQCRYDIEYLDEALTQTDAEAIADQLNTAKSIMAELADVSQQAITENNLLLSR